MKMKILASIGLASLWLFGMIWVEVTKMFFTNNITIKEYSSLIVPIIGFIIMCFICAGLLNVFKKEDNKNE